MKTLAAVSVVAVFAVTAHALDVTSCGQMVPDATVGVLQTDLDCGGAEVGVALGSGATLQLNGHAIAGAGSGVLCTGRKTCTVSGPGELTGNAVGIDAGVYGRLDVTDTSIHDNPTVGAIRRGARVRLSHVTVSHNGFGAPFPGPEYTFAIIGQKLRGNDVTVTDNGGAGIYVDQFDFQALTATGNGNVGVAVGRGRLRDSVVTGNNGLEQGIDIFTGRRPRLINTTCGKSASSAANPAPSWGVCAGD